jgi:hypothetical protein
MSLLFRTFRAGALALCFGAGAFAGEAVPPAAVATTPLPDASPIKTAAPAATAAKVVEIVSLKATPERLYATRQFTLKAQVRNPNATPLANLSWRIEDVDRHVVLYQFALALDPDETAELVTPPLLGLSAGNHVLRLAVAGAAGQPEAQRDLPLPVPPLPKLVGLGLMAIPESGGGERVLDLASTGVPANSAATLFLDFDQPVAAPLVIDLASSWSGFTLPAHVHVAPVTGACAKHGSAEVCPPRRVQVPVEVAGLRVGLHAQAVTVSASLGKETRKLDFLAVARCPVGQVRQGIDQCVAAVKPAPQPTPAALPTTKPELAPGTLPQAPAAPPAVMAGDSPREALAFCWQNKAQTWYCDGTSQDLDQVGEKDMMPQLTHAGCKNPRLLSIMKMTLTSTRVPGRGQQTGWLFDCGTKLEKGDSGHQTTNRDIRRFWSGIPW